MFGISGKQVVIFILVVVKQIVKLMDCEGYQGLCIGVKKGGCVGMEYMMDYVDIQDLMDEVVEQDGVWVMIVLMVQMFLFGMQIDYEVLFLEVSFKFNNLNVIEVCGCGELIKFEGMQFFFLLFQ